MNIIENLTNKGLITPPNHLKGNIQWLVQMGSVAYGCNTDNSDIDIYGYSIPNKNIIFPHLNSYIQGFGKQPNKFEQFQQHGIKDKETNKEYDITVYSIIKYFQLVMDNNPNIIDSLFVPRRCVLYSTQIGEHVRNNKHLFLSKKSWHTFKGYAYSQLNKMKNKNIHHFIKLCKKLNLDYNITSDHIDLLIKECISYKVKYGDLLQLKNFRSKVYQNGLVTKRMENIYKHGYDIKFGYHIIRLLNEVEQILTEHDLDLERNREQLKSIRRGEWTLEDIQTYFVKKELELETVYSSGTLQHSADENVIKKLLLECLEMHFGSLEKAIIIPTNYQRDLTKATELIENVLRRM